MMKNTFRKLAIAAAAVVMVAGLASNGAAQLVPKQGIPIRLPVQPPSPDTLIEITAGIQHTCAHKYDGSIFCWGDDALGQIGISGTTLCKMAGSLTATEPCVDTPHY